MSFTTSPNLWQGQYVRDINTATILNTDLIRAGLIRVEQGYQKYSIYKLYNNSSSMTVGNLCNAAVDTTSSMSDLQVELVEFVEKENICKHSIIDTNYDLRQLRGQFNVQIPQEFLQATVSQKYKENAKRLDGLRWAGDTSSASLLFNSQDGWLKKIRAAAGVNTVSGASGSAIKSSSTVIAELNKLVAKIPNDVYYSGKCKIIVSPEIARAYTESLSANQAYAMYALLGANGVQNLGQQGNTGFIGLMVGTNIPMYVSTGFLNNGVADNTGVALAGVFSNDVEGNLLFSTNALTDDSYISVVDLQAINPNEPFIQVAWSFKQGVEIARPTELAAYLP